jgi:hypothetical protein
MRLDGQIAEVVVSDKVHGVADEAQCQALPPNNSHIETRFLSNYNGKIYDVAAGQSSSPCQAAPEYTHCVVQHCYLDQAASADYKVSKVKLSLNTYTALQKTQHIIR